MAHSDPSKAAVLPVAEGRTSFAWISILYVGLVFTIDTLASQRVSFLFDWTMFSWSLSDLLEYLPDFQKGSPLLRIAFHFDLFKFLAWFLFPFVLCWKNLDRQWLLPTHTQKRPRLFYFFSILSVFVVLIALFLIPSLRDYYGGNTGAQQKSWLEAGLSFFVWEMSWFPGWEFLCRYVLLRAALRIRPSWGWLVVPLFEGRYHLQKPFAEAMGMAVFSLFMTAWTVQHKSMFIPFCVHFLIEIVLLIFLFLI